MVFLIVPLTAFAALIVFIHLALDAGVLVNLLRESRRSAPAAAPGARSAVLPTVTVVVAVRNEEAFLPELLFSLERQTATDCSFLFVDDRSTDGTQALLEDFRRRLGGRVSVLRNTTDPSGMTGKQAALEMAVAACRAEVVLFTDGDCTVPRAWVERMRERFLDPRLGVLFGRVRIAERRGFLARFQAFEQPLIHQYNLGGAGIGLPMGCFGNNLAARAEAIREVGGLRGLGYTVTEDAALLSAIGKRRRWKAGASVPAETAVETRIKDRWADYVNQHTRWNAGGFYARDFATRLGYRYITLYLTGSVLALPLSALDWRFSLLWIVSFLTIGSLGFLGGLYGGVRKARYFLRLAPYTAFFTVFYSWITVRAILHRSVDWKGSSLRTARRSGQSS